MSGTSLNDFIATTKLGLARTNRYLVNISVPNCIDKETSAQGVNLKTIHMFCDQLQLPGLTVNTTPIKTFGELREMPYEFNFDPIQMNFFIDRNMVVKTFFDRWIQGIQNGESRTFRYYSEYISPQITIDVQDVNDGIRYQVILFEAFPKNISAVQMGYDQKDIMKISVTMNYKYWRSDNFPNSSYEEDRNSIRGLKNLDVYGGSSNKQSSLYSSQNSPMDTLLMQLERDNVGFTSEIAQAYTGVTGGSPVSILNDYFKSFA